jgi:hypothetical protein
MSILVWRAVLVDIMSFAGGNEAILDEPEIYPV